VERREKPRVVAVSPSAVVSFTAARVTGCPVDQLAEVKVRVVVDAESCEPGVRVTVTSALGC
jgi:hypothetical protein